jgi:hypothetical protein
MKEWLGVHRDSSVGLATRFGLNGPGIESRWRGGGLGCPQLSRRPLVPTPSPVQNVLGQYSV